jgi:hypothetical protein
LCLLVVRCSFCVVGYVVTFFVADFSFVCFYHVCYVVVDLISVCGRCSIYVRSHVCCCCLFFLHVCWVVCVTLFVVVVRCFCRCLQLRITFTLLFLYAPLFTLLRSLRSFPRSTRFPFDLLRLLLLLLIARLFRWLLRSRCCSFIPVFVYVGHVCSTFPHVTAPFVYLLLLRSIWTFVALLF